MILRNDTHALTCRLVALASTSLIWYVDSSAGGYLMMSMIQRSRVLAPSEIQEHDEKYKSDCDNAGLDYDASKNMDK